MISLFDKAISIHPRADGFDDGSLAINRKAFKIKPGAFGVLANDEDAPA